MLSRSHQHPDFDGLQQRFLRLAEGVDRMIIGALHGLIQSDVQAACEVIATQTIINHLRADFEGEAHRLLAHPPPLTGRNLRSASVALVLAAELERVGEYAKDIAVVVVRSAALAPQEPPVWLGRMTRKAREMLQQAVRAVITHDSTAVDQLWQTDEAVRSVYQHVQQSLLATARANPEQSERAAYLLWVAHDLERIADRCVSIAERAAFIGTGVFPTKCREQIVAVDAPTTGFAGALSR